MESTNQSSSNNQSSFGQMYGSAIGKSFFILIVQIFIMPIRVLRSAVPSVLSEGSERESKDFVMLVWLKDIFDAVIVLAYPIGMILLIIATLDVGYNETEFFLVGLIVLYFAPLYLGIVKELVSLAIIQVLRIEQIARNTKK